MSGRVQGASQQLLGLQGVTLGWNSTAPHRSHSDVMSVPSSRNCTSLKIHTCSHACRSVLKRLVDFAFEGH